MKSFSLLGFNQHPFSVTVAVTDSKNYKETTGRTWRSENDTFQLQSVLT